MGKISETYERAARTLEPSKKQTQDPEILKQLRLRYFTPREIAGLLGFPSNFNFPASTPLRHRYRVLGNSLSVTVVSFLVHILTSD